MYEYESLNNVDKYFGTQKMQKTEYQICFMGLETNKQY